MGTDEDDSGSGASLNETNQTTCLFWGGGGAIKLRELNWNSVNPEQLGNQLYDK